MRAADMTDAIGSGNDSKTERQGYAEESDMSEQGSSATAQNQYCRSEELCSEFVT